MQTNFAGLPEYIKELKEGGIKFIVTVVKLIVFTYLMQNLKNVFIFQNPGIAHNETLIDSEYEAPALGDDMDVCNFCYLFIT